MGLSLQGRDHGCSCLPTRFAAAFSRAGLAASAHSVAYCTVGVLLGAQNFLVATGVMFVIFLPNIIWGGSSSKSSRSSAQRKAAVGKDS